MKKYGLIVAALLLLLLTLCGTALADDCGDGKHPDWTYVEVKKPTCTEDGERVKSCTVCKKELAPRERIIAVGHQRGEDIIYDPAPTCTKAGVQKILCFVCGKVMETIPVSPLNHDFGEWTTVVEPECGKKGLERRVCKRDGCDYYETRDITALEHDVSEWEIYTAPTCETSGMKYRYCKRMCGWYETETLKALEHDWTEWATVPGKKPTCTEKGQEERHCQRTDCKAKQLRNTDALGHDYTVISEKAANCTNGGYKDVLCLRCGDTNRQTTEKLGHLWGEWQEVEAPTCTKKGLAKRVCKRAGCNAEETKDINMIPHNWTEWAQTEAPTCAKVGKAERHCTYGCGTKETKDIDKLPHNWTDWVETTKATCTTPGVEERHCTNGCGAQETRNTKALDHDWTEWEITKKPTCDEPGERKHSCKRNGCDAVETEKIPARQHDWGPWIVDKKPTYTEEGEQHRECSNCHEVQREKIPKRTYANNTMCAMGPRLRDVDLSPNPNSEMWYMFTPVDVFMDGVQVYDLVASNLYTVGTMTVTIKDGFMTVEYELNDNVNIDVELEFYTVVSSMSELSEYEPEKLLSYRLPVGQPINLEEKFGDDTNLVIYFCSRIDYKFNPTTMHSLIYDSLKNQKLIKHMLSLMD